MNKQEITDTISANVPSVNIATVQQWDDGWEVYLVLFGNVAWSNVTIRNPVLGRHIRLAVDGSHDTPEWRDVPDEVIGVGQLAFEALIEFVGEGYIL